MHVNRMELVSVLEIAEKMEQTAMNASEKVQKLLIVLRKNASTLHVTVTLKVTHSVKRMVFAQVRTFL